MTITNQNARAAYEACVEADNSKAAAIDEAFEAVRTALTKYGYDTAMNDTAENLVTAIFIYADKSNGWVNTPTTAKNDCGDHDDFKAARLALNYTQEGFAEALGVSPSTIRRWEMNPTVKSSRKPNKFVWHIVDSMLIARGVTASIS